MQDFDEQVNKFLLHIDDVQKEYWNNQHWTLPRPTHRAEYVSAKWVKIIVFENNEPRSIYCFIARQDMMTKNLGNIKIGNIYKAASYKAPAKHTRGNIFDEPSWKCANPFGIE